MTAERSSPEGRIGRHREGAARIVAATFALSLARSASAQPPVGWRMDGTGNYPRAEAPIEWSPTHNVLWATPMPSRSNSSPILIGDRLFVLSEPDMLICLRASDGKILWQRANPIEDAISTQTQPLPFLQANAQIRQVQTSLQEKEYELTARRRRSSKSPDDEKASREVKILEAQVDEARLRLASLAPLMPPLTNEEAGNTSPTPTSDGDSVYALFSTGVAASYDLEGKRRWIKFLDEPQGINGVSASPVLAGDKLILAINDLIAVDKATGEFQWRVNVPFRQGTPIAFKIEEQDVLIVPSGYCVRVADGAILASGIGDLTYTSPVIRDHVLYMVQETAQAFKIPERMAEPLEFPLLWTTQLKGVRYYSSPVLLDGLIYAVERNRILNVVDATTGERLYFEKLGLGQEGGANAVYASATQGGRYVFVSGLGGTTIVLKPGRRFEQVASNELERFRSTPVFEGNRMYLRGHKNFYCISSSAEPSASGNVPPP